MIFDPALTAGCSLSGRAVVSNKLPHLTPVSPGRQSGRDWTGPAGGEETAGLSASSASPTHWVSYLYHLIPSYTIHHHTPSFVILCHLISSYTVKYHTPSYIHHLPSCTILYHHIPYTIIFTQSSILYHIIPSYTIKYHTPSY